MKKTLIVIAALLLAGDWVMARQLDKWFPSEKEPIRFVSDRKSVSLLPEEIRYIESNDKEVTVFATEGRRFRNRTGIAQWEALLGRDFVRIHRSYLVRRSAITSISFFSPAFFTREWISCVISNYSFSYCG